MSSPSSISGNNASVGIREGTRVILREITANLNNSTPGTSPRRKTSNEASSNKTDQQQQQQQDVKVRFIREFAEATGAAREGIPETSSLSSASSFQSLASTLSSKCSSGICVDSSPSKNADRSYLSSDISGLDELISACENIRLDDTSKAESIELRIECEENHSPDGTFTSATDRASLDRTRENSPLNFETDENLNLTAEIIDGNSPRNYPSSADSNLNVTTDIARATSPTNDPKPDNDLNVTREISKGISPVNLGNPETSNPVVTAEIKGISNYHFLNLTAQVQSEGSPLNFLSQGNTGLNDRRESSRENSPAKFLSQEYPEVNGTAEIRRENSPAHFPIHENPGLNVTAEIVRENSPCKFSDQGDHDPNATAKITREKSHTHFLNREISNLNVTRDIGEENLANYRFDTENLGLNETIEITNTKSDDDQPISIHTEPPAVISKENSSARNSINLDLDITRKVTIESSSINYSDGLDLDETREVTKEYSSLNPESDGQLLAAYKTFDGETKDSLANARSQTLEFVQANSASFEVEETRETFVQCVSEIGKFEDFNGSEKVSKNFNDETRLIGAEDLSENLKFAFNEDRGSNRCEEFSLDSITPTLSQFHDNLCLSRIEEEKSEISSLKISSKLNVDDSKAPKINEEFSNLTESLKQDFPENPRSPTLPSSSSILLPSESANPQNNHSKIDNPVPDLPQSLSIGRGIKKIEKPHEPVISETEKFSALAGSEFSADSISKIQEPTFFDLVESNEDSRGKELRNHEVSVTSETKKVESSENCLAFERSTKKDTKEEKPIEKSSKTKKLIPEDKNEELLPGETEIYEKEEFHKPEGINVEIEKESFPEVGDKRDEDLDATVTAEDLSGEDIAGIPEPEQYTEFAPKRQSTALVSQHRLESQKSSLVAGATSDRLTSVTRGISVNEEYSAFLPQKQSTSLDNFSSPLSSRLERQRTPFVTALSPSTIHGDNTKKNPSKKVESFEDRCNFAKLELAANSVANDIFNTSLELAEDNEHFVSAESEVFHDPSNFDFLLRKTPRKNTKRDLRDLSLYVKFDPLVSNASMLPQGNIQHASPPVSEARNGENNTTMANIGTPKRNPAIAAIDRLLFYSPMSANTTPTNTNTTIQKTNDTQEKLKPSEETSEETVNMAKELELVRTTVLQLEEQLEKLKIDHDEALEKQASYKEKINQLQAQLAQEIKNKNEITVVVDEYEISISRLVAERERDRKNLDLEKAKLQEELAAAKHHLDNTEAAFNDVHLKYERLKAVVATYKANEAALKESLQENVEIIKSLENRYEQVKSHATARLEKANQDLEEIRKQNESETVRLHAMLRKAELKSNSLAELVEQKTKENKELAQILDDFIARVGNNKE